MAINRFDSEQVLSFFPFAGARLTSMEFEFDASGHFGQEATDSAAFLDLLALAPHLATRQDGSRPVVEPGRRRRRKKMPFRRVPRGWTKALHLMA